MQPTNTTKLTFAAFSLLAFCYLSYEASGFLTGITGISNNAWKLVSPVATILCVFLVLQETMAGAASVASKKEITL